jgi:hypothetical protein
VSVLAIGLSGGVALASDSPQATTAQIHACYKTGQNPSGLELLTKGSCPKGFSTATWNVKGPTGPAGPRGATGPQGHTGSTGAKGATGAKGPAGPQGVQGSAGPQGPAGTFGSITTYSDDLSVPPDEEGALAPGCPAGSAVISGGVTYGGYTEGVSIVADAPNPESGTPTSWLGNVANVGTSTVTMTVSVVCAAPAGAAASNAPASRDARPSQVKGTLAEGANGRADPAASRDSSSGPPGRRDAH